MHHRTMNREWVVALAMLFRNIGVAVSSNKR